RDANAGLSDYTRSSALIAQWALDPTTAGYARWWLDHMTTLSQFRWFEFQDFLWYRTEVPALDYTATLPTGSLASASGFMTSRSSWAPDATYVTMICGPTLQVHEDLAQNGFLLYRGEWLGASARIKGLGGMERGAADNNAITIGGLG